MSRKLKTFLLKSTNDSLSLCEHEEMSYREAILIIVDSSCVLSISHFANKRKSKTKTDIYVELKQ